jgi:HrpA-like RNA helicase
MKLLPNLELVLMSATLDDKKYQAHFKWVFDRLLCVMPAWRP